MPKRNESMTPREVEICERAHFVRREIAKWSQPDLAREMGITQNQLAGVEYKRSPLRYGMAIVLCKKFNINQRWLALGVKPIQPMLDIPMDQSAPAKPNVLFSEAFDVWLDQPTERIEDGLIDMMGEENYRSGNFDDAVFSNFPRGDSLPHEAVVMLVRKLVNQQINWLPSDLQLEYAQAIMSATEKFSAKNADKIKKVLPPAQRKVAQPASGAAESLVDKTSEIRNSSSEMKLTLSALLDDVRKLTKPYGMKAKLASDIGVPPPRVNEWLGGKYEPSGEVTLQLLNWVKQQKRKK